MTLRAEGSGQHMMGSASSRLNSKRALATFLCGYVVINILSTVTTLVIAAILHVNLSGHSVNIHNHAVVVAERYYPLLNLLVWLAASWLYFRHPTPGEIDTSEALRLGLLWLALGLIFNEMLFVLIDTPYSFTAHDWYIGQFPWIYVTYLLVFLCPVIYTMGVNRNDRATQP